MQTKSFYLLFVVFKKYIKLELIYVSVLFEHPAHFNYANDNQCWGKLLLKVMHYNIALLSKKVTNYVT